MKYTACFGLSLVAIASASSASIAERDPAPYQKVINSITTDVTALDAAVNKFSGGDKQPVIDASDALIKAINNGKMTIDGLPDLSASDALPLAGSLTALNTQSQELITDLKRKRSDVENANGCDAVRKALEDINTSSQALVKSAILKVPQSFQTVANGYLSGYTKSFNDTQDYFSAANCKDGGGSGNSTSTTASSASSSTTNSSGGSASSPTTAQSSATSSQAAASPSGKNDGTMLAPVWTWTLGTAMVVISVYC